MRRLLRAAQPDDIIAAVAVEAAKAVPELQPVARRVPRRRGSAGCRGHDGPLVLDRPFAARVQLGGFGPLDLVEDRAVARVQHDAGGREKRAVGVLVHEIAAHREDMLARALLTAAHPAVLAKRFDRLLQVLHIGGCLLVDDDEIGDDGARPHIFLHAQGRRDDVEVCDVADHQGEDRIVARNCPRPQVGLLAEARRADVGRKPHPGFRIEQIAREFLHIRRVGEAEAAMAGLHL